MPSHGKCTCCNPLNPSEHPPLSICLFSSSFITKHCTAVQYLSILAIYGSCGVDPLCTHTLKSISVLILISCVVVQADSLVGACSTLRTYTTSFSHDSECLLCNSTCGDVKAPLHRKVTLFPSKVGRKIPYSPA